jgi:hypothetical protein
VARFCVQFLEPTLEIMPQTRVEKKFCSLPSVSWRQNINSIIAEKLTLTEFEEIEGFLKKYTGGEK